MTRDVRIEAAAGKLARTVGFLQSGGDMSDADIVDRTRVIIEAYLDAGDTVYVQTSEVRHDTTRNKYGTHCLRRGCTTKAGCTGLVPLRPEGVE